jgi:hypothetical protein
MSETKVTIGYPEKDPARPSMKPKWVLPHRCEQRKRPATIGSTTRVSKRRAYFSENEA